MDGPREQIIRSLQANAVRHGYEPITDAGAALVLHELAHAITHGAGRERTMGALLMKLGRVVFWSSNTSTV